MTKKKQIKEVNYICLKSEQPLIEPRGGEHFFGSHIIVQPDDSFKQQVAITRAYQCDSAERNWHGSTLRFSSLEAYALLEALLKFFQCEKKAKVTVWTPDDLDVKGIKARLKEKVIKKK